MFVIPLKLDKLREKITEVSFLTSETIIFFIAFKFLIFGTNNFLSNK